MRKLAAETAFADRYSRLEKIEKTNFKGDHIVECYCVKNRIVVAKDRIHVPIASNQKDDE